MESNDGKNPEVPMEDDKNGKDGVSSNDQPNSMPADQSRQSCGNDVFSLIGIHEKKTSDLPEAVVVKNLGMSEDPANTEASRISEIGNRTEGNAVPKNGVLRMPVDEPDAECYNMNHKHRGKCVVFNQVNFDMPDCSPRTSSIADVVEIYETFTILDFEILVFHDLKRQQVIDKIAELATGNYENDDCFCIVILSHGIGGGMICAKDAVYRDDEIWKPFTADKCPTLAGKPKLFFIEACRGGAFTEGVTMARKEFAYNTVPDQDGRSCSIPTSADFFIIHATQPGYVAFVNEASGSWLMQSVCDALKEHATTKNFGMIMTIATRKVALKTSFHDKLPHISDKKQIPTITSTLIRDIYFSPKH